MQLQDPKVTRITATEHQLLDQVLLQVQAVATANLPEVAQQIQDPHQDEDNFLCVFLISIKGCFVITERPFNTTIWTISSFNLSNVL